MRRVFTPLLLACAAVPLLGAQEDPDPWARWRHLVRTDTWTERWPAADGEIKERRVTDELWTRAMQAVLEVAGSLHIPDRGRPYYLDGPLILKSGQSLRADPGAEIRLKPGSNSCLVRNFSIVGYAGSPVPGETRPDSDIHIEGGIWTTLATSARESNGNLRGASAHDQPVFGTHGVILLHNVRRASVRHLTVRQSRAFGVHLGNVQDFQIEDVTLDRHHRDGVHVNGPASRGLIRQVRGDSADDTVALNAWEWRNYAPSYGPIHDIVIEDVTGTGGRTHAADSIRLLPGVKRFDDGTLLPCPVHDITLRRITDIREFKLYDQPNLELGRDRDFSVGLGSLRSIRLEDLVFHVPGRIEVHAEAQGIHLRNVTVHHPLDAAWHLLALGPKSMTYKAGPDPSNWREVFSPDIDCTVREVTVDGVREAGSSQDLPLDRVVKVIELKPNPDYPRTTPKGGKGRGLWIR